MNKILAVITTMFVGVGVALLLGFPVMWLWNWLMPKLFNVVTINFWEALGINMLTGFLFKPSMRK